MSNQMTEIDYCVQGILILTPIGVEYEPTFLLPFSFLDKFVYDYMLALFYNKLAILSLRLHKL